MNNKKRIPAILAFLLVVVFISISCCGCGSSPATVVKGYLDSLKKFDFESMQKYTVASDENLSDQFSGIGGLDELDGASATFYEYIKENLTKMTYSVGDANMNKDKATVKVKIKYIDPTEPFVAAIKTYLGQALVAAFSGESDDASTNKILEDALNDAFKTSESKPAEADFTFSLEKTSDGWKISETPNGLEKLAIGDLTDALSELADSFNN